MGVLKRQPGRVKASPADIASYIYIASRDTFNVLSKPVPSTTPGDEATIAADHTFVTATPANGFIKIPCTGNKNGKFSVKTEGEFPAQKVVSSFEGNAVGLSAEQIEIMQRLMGIPVIVLISSAKCENPTVYQIGCDCNSINGLMFEFDTDSNVWKISGSSNCFPAVYTGAITLMG